MWAQELHLGDACLSQVPAVLGRHMAGGPSRNQTGGWLGMLRLLRIAATRGGRFKGMEVC